MADFLNRLAARALGAIPLAEPGIPTRFSSVAEQSAFLACEAAFQPTRPAPETSLETSENRPHPLHIHETNPNLATSVARPASPFEGPDEAPHLPRSQRTRAFPWQAPPPPPYAESETIQPSPERAEVEKQHLVAAMNPTPDEVEKQYIVAAMNPTPDEVERPAAQTARVTSPAPVQFATPQPAPRLTPLAEPMRSRVSQHSEWPQGFHSIRPTVSVSIGRIEVRAEITSPTAPVQRPRPSTLSLDQFLKQVDGSAR